MGSQVATAEPMMRMEEVPIGTIFRYRGKLWVRVNEKRIQRIYRELEVIVTMILSASPRAKDAL
jgi:hypothetical protein